MRKTRKAGAYDPNVQQRDDEDDNVRPVVYGDENLQNLNLNVQRPPVERNVRYEAWQRAEEAAAAPAPVNRQGARRRRRRTLKSKAPKVLAKRRK